MLNTNLVEVRRIRHGHLCCGVGGGARGFNKANPRVGNMVGQFECVGGIDVDPAAIRDFERLTGVKGTVMDLFDREQYTAFHGHEPPQGWQQAMPEDVLKSFNYQIPHILFMSAPCKGFSGLLSESKSKTEKYQALNRLTLRCVWLALEAFKSDPVELLIFENVPRIATRGRKLLDHIEGLMRAYGYIVRETTHDCGELGGLAQSRKRFLLVARHAEKVPNLLFVPKKKKMRGVGDILDKMPVPGDGRGGPMHRVPSLQWQTWVRLAFVRAGSDWRSLSDLNVTDGYLRDYLIVPEMHSGTLGVKRWDEPSCTIGGRSLPGNNAYSVADPRMPRSESWKDGNAFGVVDWPETTSTIAGQQSPGQGRYSVADPRHHGPEKFNNVYNIVRWDQASATVTGSGASKQCVADPRIELRGGGMGVLEWNSTAGAVAGESLPSNGKFAVADPRPSGLSRKDRNVYLTAGHYGVVPWSDKTGAVSSAACHDNGKWAVADPRLPAATDRTVAVIRSLDDTWHRPFTTLELAALQSLVDPEDLFSLDGDSDQAHRERIGNAVPSDSAQAIAETMGLTLLLAWKGEKFILSDLPVWVHPVAVALSVSNQMEHVSE